MVNELNIKQETVLDWLVSGGTNAFGINSVANNAGRKGGGVDLGAVRTRLFRAYLKLAVNVAPTLGNIVTMYWASSFDNSLFDGNLSAADAAFTTVDVLPQLALIGSMYLDDVTTVQVTSWDFEAPARYGFPVFWNTSGQTMNATGGNFGFWLSPQTEELQ